MKIVSKESKSGKQGANLEYLVKKGKYGTNSRKNMLASRR